MHTDIALEADPSQPTRAGEDWAQSENGLVAVLDGVTSSGDGCHHGTAWYVKHLGEEILRDASRPGTPLDEILRRALQVVRDRHARTCDLHRPATPAAAVALLRAHGPVLEWLVLADTTIVLQTADGPRAISDARVDQVARDQQERVAAHPIGSYGHRDAVPALIAAQMRLRNCAGGYWVAASDPGVSRHAITGSMPRDGVTGALVVTDGAARLVDVFGLRTWDQVAALADSEGAAAVIRETRAAELRDPAGTRWPRLKPHDDAAIVRVAWTENPLVSPSVTGNSPVRGRAKDAKDA